MSLAKRFWRRLTLFAYKHYTGSDKVAPLGTRFIRDPDAPCEEYDPRKHLGTWADCDTDGHYLCKNCCHRNLENWNANVSN